MDEWRKEKENSLNQAALQWKTTPPEGNEAVIESLRQQVFILSFELFDRKFRRTKNGEWVEADPKVFMTAFEEAIQKYSPDKGKFCNYLSFLLQKREYDQLDSDSRHAPWAESLDGLISASEDGGRTLGDLTPAAAGVPDSGIMFEALYVEMAALVLNFARNHTRRQANESRRNWYRIFFTEDMTLTYKTKSYAFSHERDIFDAMLLPYLDYYMSRPCRTGMEIACTPLRPYGEVVPAREGGGEETKVPLPADVSLAYLSLCEGVSATAGARSNQLKFYREEVGQIRTC